MFRAAAPGPYDEAISKATDENLTSEDWGAIMEVCDRVTTDANGSKDAVQSLIKRLAHRNANVQLYTLEVANALSQNCGKAMHRELASRAFTDALLKLANDRNTHNQVKAKILERMKEWTEMFKSDVELGIMADAYHRLKQANPTLHPPSAPQKNSLTDVDRQKEEEELQMALKLSLQDEERKKSVSSGAGPSGAGAAAPGQSATPAPVVPHPSGTTAATVSRVRALFDFVPSEPGELEFKKGDVIAVLESVYKDWWRGSLKGKTGIFPLNYVEKLTDPTPDELHREAQMEAEVFAEIKNVEKLLTLLSTSNAPREEDNEEISKLYHQTLAIRPKLIKLIEKYSQKKDDFTQLNEKFIKARRDYEALLESSMSHPPQPTYHQYAMRPQIPQGYPTPGPSYTPTPQGLPAQDQRFYTPAPAQEQPHFPQSIPSPNFQRPGAGSGPAPAPFYVVGAEVPSQAGQPPIQQQQQQQQAPSQTQPQHQPQHQPLQYPPREQGPRVPSGAKQPAPIHTSSPPPATQYQAYQVPSNAARPQSYGGAPQELSTSVYDSPIAPHNPASMANYTSHSPEDPYTSSSPVAGGPPKASAPSAPPPQPSAPAPSAPPQGYQPYNPYHTHPQQQQPQPAYNGAGYDYDGANNDAPIPPAPTGQAPPPPTPQQPQQRPGNVLTPPPLQPSGAAYDARQTLPSRLPGAPQDGAVAGVGGAPQYKAYVPPVPSAPPVDEGPSAPSDYYRTAAY